MKRLTKKQAIDRTIELWEWLAESGAESKARWAGWQEYGYVAHYCPLCQYNNQRGGTSYVDGDCKFCPYFRRFQRCTTRDETTIFDKWAHAKNEKKLKKYAKLFLEQMYEVRDEKG